MDYQNKVNNMINEGIAEGKYIEAVDNTHKNLKCFQCFLYRNLYKHEQYENMCPKSNQPGRYFATAKTHKFDSINDINLDQLKFRPVIDQTRKYIYNASKAVGKYLRPLSKNKHSIHVTLTFTDLLRNAEKSEDYEDVSCDIENLFMSTSVKEAIDYIIREIHVTTEIKPFCKSLFLKNY